MHGQYNKQGWTGMYTFVVVITKKRNDPKPAETSPSHQILTETRPSLSETSGNKPLPPKTDLCDHLNGCPGDSVPDQVGALVQDGTSPNMGWPNKELTTLSLLWPKVP